MHSKGSTNNKLNNPSRFYGGTQVKGLGGPASKTFRFFVVTSPFSSNFWPAFALFHLMLDFVNEAQMLRLIITPRTISLLSHSESFELQRHHQYVFILLHKFSVYLLSIVSVYVTLFFLYRSKKTSCFLCSFTPVLAL